MDEFIKKKFVACEDCQYAIIAGTAEKDVSIAEHLAQCPDCRSFADFQQSLLAADPVIHNQIPDFAGIRKEAERRQRVWRTNLRFVLLPLSAAAAAMIAVGGIFFHTRVEPISTTEYLLADAEVLTAVAEVIYETEDATDAGRILIGFEDGQKSAKEVQFTYYYDKGWVLKKLEEK